MSAQTPQDFLSAQTDLPPQERLRALVRVLRGPEGCPWDQKQTAATIIDFVIDEAHELKEAIEAGRVQEIVEELGDLLFTSTFLTETLGAPAAEATAVKAVVAKMIARHPHVFDNGEGSSEAPVMEADVKRRWEKLKLQNEPSKGRRLDRDLAASLPAWKKAAKILSRARNSGFRYPSPEAAWEKVTEEWLELQTALGQDCLERQEAELGDLLLALLTASIESGLDCERAILRAGKTLADRIERIEVMSGKSLAEIPYEDLARWYDKARVGPDSSTTDTQL